MFVTNVSSYLEKKQKHKIWRRPNEWGTPKSPCLFHDTSRHGHIYDLDDLGAAYETPRTTRMKLSYLYTISQMRPMVLVYLSKYLHFMGDLIGVSTMWGPPAMFVGLQTH